MVPIRRQPLMKERSSYKMTDEKPIERHTFSILVDNEPGVLAKVIGLFSARGYNIESLTVAEVQTKRHISRITVVTRGTPHILAQIQAQLERVVAVSKVRDMTMLGPHLERELALVKVQCEGEKRVEALRVAEIFRVNTVDLTQDSFVFEITGTSEKINAFIELMRPLGLLNVCRTGVVAISRGNKIL